MTPEDLRDVLRRLADHIHTIREGLEDSGLPPASGTSSGVRSKAPGPRDPCDLTSLSRLIEDTEAKVWGWCVNLASDLSIHLLDPRGQPLIEHEAHGSAWCAWLNRNRTKLFDLPWAEDCAVELADLEAELSSEIHPAEPDALKVSDYPTVAELAAVAHCSPEAMHKRLQRKGIRPIRVIAGENVYEREALDQVTR